MKIDQIITMKLLYFLLLILSMIFLLEND